MEEKVLNIAKKILETDDISLETSKESCELWDSLAHIMIIAELADTLNIIVPMEESERINCIKDFLKYVK